MKALVTASLAVATLALAPGSARAIDSVRLSDTIRASGTGTINLLRDVTPAALESYRQEHGGALVLAVDVNEAASGSEKSSSQGIAFDTVVLRVTVAGVQRTYPVFETDTQAVLARTGATARSTYFTSIGESGSSRITSSNSIQGVFDAVIRIPVDASLAGATAVVLEVDLLDVNVGLGDPEAFYDYTGGYEDLALVNLTDATYLTELAPGRVEAPAVVLTNPPPPGAPAPTTPAVESWISYPSATTFYTVAYEDLYPQRGDYDFNDLVVSYRVEVGLTASGQVGAVRGSAYLVARGAGYTHDWHLRLGGTAGTTTAQLAQQLHRPDGTVAPAIARRVSAPIDLLVLANTRALAPPAPGASFTNTEPGTTFVAGPRVDFSLVLDTPLAPSALGVAPFDPYLLVTGVGYEVHLPGRAPTAGSRNAAEGRTSFVDERGYPFAFLLPASWSFPYERTDTGLAYPTLSDYAVSGGARAPDWYAHPDPARVRAYVESAWHW